MHRDTFAYVDRMTEQVSFRRACTLAYTHSGCEHAGVLLVRTTHARERERERSFFSPLLYAFKVHTYELKTGVEVYMSITFA